MKENTTTACAMWLLLGTFCCQFQAEFCRVQFWIRINKTAEWYQSLYKLSSSTSPSCSLLKVEADTLYIIEGTRVWDIARKRWLHSNDFINRFRFVHHFSILMNNHLGAFFWWLVFSADANPRAANAVIHFYWGGVLCGSTTRWFHLHMCATRCTKLGRSQADSSGSPNFASLNFPFICRDCGRSG